MYSYIRIVQVQQNTIDNITNVYTLKISNYIYVATSTTEKLWS